MSVSRNHTGGTAVFVLVGLSAPIAGLVSGQSKTNEAFLSGVEDSLDVSGYPAEMQEGYELYKQKCNKCHPAGRSLSIEDRAWWKNYLNWKTRVSGSGINPAVAAKIYAFVEYYQTEMPRRETVTTARQLERVLARIERQALAQRPNAGASIRNCTLRLQGELTKNLLSSSGGVTLFPRAMTRHILRRVDGGADAKMLQDEIVNTMKADGYVGEDAALGK